MRRAHRRREPRRGSARDDKFAKIGMDGASQPRDRPKLDAGNRWKTEARIAGGGRAGAPSWNARDARRTRWTGEPTRRVTGPIIASDPIVQSSRRRRRRRRRRARGGVTRGSRVRRRRVVARRRRPRRGSIRRPRGSTKRRPRARDIRVGGASYGADGRGGGRSVGGTGWRRRGWRSAMPRDAVSLRWRSPNERDVAAAGEGTGASSTHGKKKGTRKGRMRGRVERAHLFGILRRRRRRRRVVGHLALDLYR